MADTQLPQLFYIENRKKFLTQLDNYSCVVLFAGEAPIKSADEPYRFTPNRNFLYLTGIDAPKLVYFAYKTYGKIDEYLFIERLDPEKARWVGASIGKDEAHELSGIQNIEFLDCFLDTLYSAIDANRITNLFLDLENRFGKHAQYPALRFYDDFSKNMPAVRLRDASKTIYSMRTIKQDVELEQMQKAINLTALGIEHVMTSISENMMEYQIESCFDFALKYNGVRDKAFDSIFAAGKNATILHYSSNSCQVPPNSLVLMDLGATWNYYCADITRTIPASGKFTDRQRELYNIVLEGQIAAINSVKPGVTLFELNDGLKEYYKSALKKAGLIPRKCHGEQLTRAVESLYWHKLGHSLGLDAHDCAPRDVKLEPGMVITIEPGLYVESEAIGIRIEDDILVTETGGKNLSAMIPKTVEEIEAAIAELRDSQ